MREVIAILAAKVSPKGDDATGQLSAGELVVRGRGLEGSIHSLADQPDMHTDLCWQLTVPLGNGHDSYRSDETFGGDLH